MNFGQAKERIKTPGATLIIPVAAFADEWENRPSSAVCVGLRLLSNADRQKARHVAETQSNEVHPFGGDGWIECYNDAVKRQVAALSMCDPNDVNKPHELFPYAEDQVSSAFTVRGVQLVFDAVEQHEIDSSPLERPADTETLQRLARLLPLVDATALTGRLGRRLTCMLDEIEALVEPGLVDDPRHEVQSLVGEQSFVSGALGAS